jgi:transcriptional regulator with XRE-family HTH domain
MTELGDFLQSRRARLTPEETGLPTFGGRRRVPGLRREELAQLAGVSADYYSRLEQSRLQNVSDEVLNAVARALRLDDGERTHLFNLARPPRQTKATQVRPGVRWLVDNITGSPAYVLGRNMDIVAWNDLAQAMYGVDLQQHNNMARLIFQVESSRALWTPWEDKANNTVGGLRMQSVLFPGDPELSALVAELSEVSPEFRALWTAHEVWTVPNGTMRLHHRVVGPLTLAYEALPIPDAPEQVLITYSAEPGSPTEDAIKRLATDGVALGATGVCSGAE